MSASAGGPWTLEYVLDWSAAVHAVLTVGRLLGARAIVMLNAELLSMTSDWLRGLAAPVLKEEYGLVLPLYPDILDDIEVNRDRLDIARAADRIVQPWLVLHGANDETVPFREAEALAASAARPTLIPVERTGHTFGAVHPFSGLTPALAQVFDATVAFLGRHLT